MTLHAIVLAAGTGGRMGGAKARLIVSGVPLATSHATRLREVGCADIVMVVRAEDVDVVPPGVLTAISSAPDPAGSLRVGLKQVPREDNVVIITPVDALPALADTLRALVRALDQRGILAATPTCRGQGGHPVVIRRTALDALAPGVSLRDVLVGLGERRARVETDDPAVLTDLDVPGDVLAASGQPPAFTLKSGA